MSMSILPDPCDFGIVFALSIESGALVDQLSNVSVTRAAGFTIRQGQLGEHRVVLVESGAGRENAVKATHALLDAHRPRRVVSAGFAGGLVESIRRGDLLVADSVVHSEGSLWTAAPSPLPSWLSEYPNLHVGRLLTVDAVVRLPDEKRALGERHQAIAADMESLWVAEVCQQREVPLMVVRAISDSVQDQLPPDVGRLLAQKTTAARLGAAVRSIVNRPSSFVDLIKLQQNALAASEKLAELLVRIVSTPPQVLK
jgi:adenosylhomocysteine nucleosidase